MSTETTTAMQHPVQALATTDSLLITASNTVLTCFDLSTNAQVATAILHTALIRSVATYTDSATSTSYLISTGEDKQLVVSKLPSLELASTRELPKRANVIDVTQAGEIVVGDKFGDVYIFPIHPPASDATPSAPVDSKDKTKEKKPEYSPILGHVSMLNTLALIPTADGKTYIATGDRDEHVRISRYPLGHVIEGFLWGSKHFVSSLLYLPPASPTSPSYLLSGGGDPTLQLFSLTLPSQTPAPSRTSLTASPVGDLVSQYNIEELLMPYIHVGPVLPDPVPIGSKKQRKHNKKGKAKAAAAAAAAATGEEGEGEAEEVEVEGDVTMDKAEEVDETETPGDEAAGDRKSLKKGLAVIKMLEVGTTREKGGVVVLAGGSTALLYIPFSALLPSTDASAPKGTPSILPFSHPILDFVPVSIPSSASSAMEFILSFDTTRPIPPTTTSDNIPSPSHSSDPLSRVSLSQTGQLVALPTSTTDSVLLASASTSTDLQPGIQSLYPQLMLLHHPGDESDLIGGDESAPVEGAAETTGGWTKKGKAKGKGAGFAGDGKPKGGFIPGTKRTSSERLSEAGEGEGEESSRLGGGEGKAAVGKGRRAIGRQETLRRWEEAKKKLEQGSKQEDLTVGEQEAVKEIEAQAKEGQVAKEEGAVIA